MRYSQSEKIEVIRIVENSNLSVRKTLRELDISPSTFYSWYGKYLEGGYDALENNHKAPKQFWNAIPEWEKDRIVDVARTFPEKSCREIACYIIDNLGYYVSESSVYRILKAKDLIQSPVFTLISAKDKFQHPTTRVNQLWQTDFTYFKIINWGWYYLSTILDDFSRYIIAWKLCTTMTAEDVKDTLDIAIEKTGVTHVKVVSRPRLLTDNGPCYVSAHLKDYLEIQEMAHTRGRPYHPQTQGKIERYHRSMKNLILLDNYYTPEALEDQISTWVDYYNNHRYYEAIDNITPSDKFHGRDQRILKKRKAVKKKTMRIRRQINMS